MSRLGKNGLPSPGARRTCGGRLDDDFFLQLFKKTNLWKVRSEGVRNPVRTGQRPALTALDRPEMGDRVGRLEGNGLVRTLVLALVAAAGPRARAASSASGS